MKDDKKTYIHPGGGTVRIDRTPQRGEKPAPPPDPKREPEKNKYADAPRPKNSKLPK